MQVPLIKIFGKNFNVFKYSSGNWDIFLEVKWRKTSSKLKMTKNDHFWPMRKIQIFIMFKKSNREIFEKRIFGF